MIRLVRRDINIIHSTVKETVDRVSQESKDRTNGICQHFVSKSMESAEG